MAQYLVRAGARPRRRSRAPTPRARHLEAALEANRKCVRASLLLGDLEKAPATARRARSSTGSASRSQDPAYLALVAQRLLDAYREPAAPRRACTLLAGYLERYPSLDLLDTVFQQTLEAEGRRGGLRAGARRAAAQPDAARPRPAARGADPRRRRPSGAATSSWCRNLVHSHTQRLARYRCENCGFKARQFHWRCPACGGWETYPPRRTEEFDARPP